MYNPLKITSNLPKPRCTIFCYLLIPRFWRWFITGCNRDRDNKPIKAMFQVIFRCYVGSKLVTILTTTSHYVTFCLTNIIILSYAFSLINFVRGIFGNHSINILNLLLVNLWNLQMKSFNLSPFPLQNGV